jgi:hypothetical protein
MIGTPFFRFLGYRDPIYAAADIKRMCARGEVTTLQSCEIIQHLHGKGLFTEPMTGSQRTLLAVLTRAGRFRPRLVVDNTTSSHAAQTMDSPLAG